MSEFKQYLRTKISELRPYIEGEDLKGITITGVDIEAGSPRVGDMIARNPENHNDQWLMTENYFKENFLLSKMNFLLTSKGE